MVISVLVGVLFVAAVSLRQERPIETQRIQAGALNLPAPHDGWRGARV